jgi:hypothetical protein
MVPPNVRVIHEAYRMFEVELGTNRGLTAAVRLGNHKNAVGVWDFLKDAFLIY